MTAAMQDYYLPKDRIKRIHVDQHKIRRGDDDVITVQTSSGPVKANELDIVVDGKVVATFFYRPDSPLSCGAKCYVETKAEVRIR